MAPQKQKQMQKHATGAAHGSAAVVPARGNGHATKATGVPANRRRTTKTTFKYDCGAADVASIVQLNDSGDCWPFAQATNEIGVANISLWCTCGSLLNGALAAFMLERADKVADGSADDEGVLPYGACHHGEHPPAPWQELRPQRDLALELTQVAARVDQRFPHDQCSGTKFAWLPTFLWLPESVVRPTTVQGLMRLVITLVDDVRGSQSALEALWRKLSSKKRALAWYDEAAEHDEAAEEAAVGMLEDKHDNATDNGMGEAHPQDNSKDCDSKGRDSKVEGNDRTKHTGKGGVGDDHDVHTYDSVDAAFLKANPKYTDEAMQAAADADPSGWTKRRQVVDKLLWQWRFFKARCARLTFMSFQHPWEQDELPTMTDAEYDTYVVSQLAAFDAMAGAFAAKCTLSVTYSCQLDVGGEQYTEEPSMAYYVGLSPDGHLVGSTTVVLPPI